MVFWVAHPAPAPKQMSKSIKFLEDGVICVESVQEFVQDNSDFLVVGIVGPQGVGKSTILNLLAHNRITKNLKRDIFTDVTPKQDEYDADGIKILSDNVSNMTVQDNAKNSNNMVFKTQSVGEAEGDNNTTYGIDLYITSNRAS